MTPEQPNPSVPGLSSAPVSRVDGPAVQGGQSELISAPPRPGLVGMVDRFELIKVVGTGGMGTVYQARDSQSGVQVALKILRSEYARNADLVRRFSAEARNQQKLKHPHIVPVLEVKELDKGAFFTMPLFTGGSLASRIRAKGPLPGSAVLQIAFAIAQALAFAHTRGIIHRDIKPANVLLPEDSSVCLADFGLARSLLEQTVVEVESKPVEGTPAYLSPQLAAGKAEDTRCDIYGFGALLYELLTGSPPYTGKTLAEIREKIGSGPPDPIRNRAPNADPKLTEIAEWAMAREHRDRYASMDDVVADLELVRVGKLPVGPHRRWRPWAGLKRVPVAAGGLAALVATALAAWQLVWPGTRLEVVHSFASPHISSWGDAQVCERNNVPGKEIAIPGPVSLLTFSGAGDYLESWDWPFTGRQPVAVESIHLANDPLDALSVSWNSNSMLVLSILNDAPFEIARFQMDGPRPNNENPRTAALVSPFLLPAVDSPDGREKLLALMTTGFNGGPRALCSFDWQSRKLEWTRPAGCPFATPLLFDLNGDGKREIILGSFAPQNGITAPDGSTDDAHSYAFAYTTDGTKLWQTNFSSGHSTTRLFLAASSTGKKEIIAWVHFHYSTEKRDGTNSSKIVRLSPKGDALQTYSPGVNLHPAVVVDLNADGSDEILCADSEGCIHVVSTEPQLLRKVHFFDPGRVRPGSLDRVESRIPGAGHLLSRDRLHLVVAAARMRREEFRNPGRWVETADPESCENITIAVLDDQLETVAEYVLYKGGPAIAWEVCIADMDGDGLDEILSLKDKVEILKLMSR